MFNFLQSVVNSIETVSLIGRSENLLTKISKYLSNESYFDMESKKIQTL